MYSPSVVGRLRFIRRAQELGFTLAEIAELLDLRVQDGAACDVVEARARRKLADIESKISDLGRIGDALGRLVEKCVARQPTGDCPILEELGEEWNGTP
jgi:MerR family mercuric resistance operon transcriptional regulator